ncbi:hypothetical protein M7I_0852 [Glarea lozoyensis 74030]|uniref:Uncharacterized protein n=1 Tax=Glarea lozoyensis (strain ATCC 74030 / MF5533) TaxID=1104152 RepID=H0EEH5_GLAL7|nr:hypothetical protein M7I_0852 [Glarea lozoyensis 74030]
MHRQYFAKRKPLFGIISERFNGDFKYTVLSQGVK